MKTIFPAKLKSGDTIMVISPSDSLSFLSENYRKIAAQRFFELGLKVIFSKNSEEVNEFDSSSIESRVEDIHTAFLDNNVKAVFTAFGGYNSNQLLNYIDWSVIQNNPKIFIGFSDTTVLQNAIYTKTGLVTYSGPSYARFGQELYFEFTLNYILKCLFSDEAFIIESSSEWSDDWWLSNQKERQLIKNQGWDIINYGETSGHILGGNLSTFNLLQGTEFFPDLTNSILFIEDDNESKIGHFDRDLQSLIHQPNFDQVSGIVIGRFQNDSKIKTETLRKIIRTKSELEHIPIIANVDFGHTDPIITFPIGGDVKIDAFSEKAKIQILKH